MNELIQIIPSLQNDQATDPLIAHPESRFYNFIHTLVREFLRVSKKKCRERNASQHFPYLLLKDNHQDKEEDRPEVLKPPHGEG